MSPESLKTKLRAVLVEHFRVEAGALHDNTPLFSSGLLDSLSVVDFVGHVEREASVSIAPDDITLENFDSLSRIVAYLASRKP